MTDSAIVDAWSGRFVGRVRQLRCTPAGQECFHDAKNLVVDSALEVMIRALQGQESIRGVEFGFTGGVPVSPGLRSVRSPVGFAPSGATNDTRPFISRDASGLRSIGTWTATFTAPQALSYDTLGLVSDSSLLFAAVAFDTVSLAVAETIAVQWTISLRS